MFSDSARQPLYLRSSNVAQASDDDAFWRTLQDRMASLNMNMTAANDQGQDNEHALPVFADLAGHDHTFDMGHDIIDGSGDNSDETSLHPPQKPLAARRQGGSSWLLGFAGLDGTFALAAERGRDGDRSAVPGLVRVPSSDSEGDSDLDSDSDGDSVSSSPSPAAEPAKKGVSFSSTVEVRTIPHSSSLSSSQRRRMYASSSEIRRNKNRNKKEFRYDGYDWRNATEERDMGVCRVTGELVHPAHDHELSC